MAPGPLQPTASRGDSPQGILLTLVQGCHPGKAEEERVSGGGSQRVLSCLCAGTLKAMFFIFASLCAWYSGYLLAELIPDVSLSRAAYSIRSIGERPVLKGGYHSGVQARTRIPAAVLRLGPDLSTAPTGHLC